MGELFPAVYRSPHRHLAIRWAGATPIWQPPQGKVLEAPVGTSRFVVPAEADAAALIASAAAAGAVAAVTYAPPDLDEVFLELVAP